jgi:hypothetical protein
MKKELTTSQIANAIVDLVERAGGPVTLARIEREVPNFAQLDGRRNWSWVTGDDDEHMIWDGMTDQGCEALRRVVLERRVAIQSCPSAVYAFESRWPRDPTWAPIVLVPASMANLETPRLLIRGSQQVMDMMTARAAAEGVSGFRVIGPAA